MRVIGLYDIGPGVGMGHFRRLQALAAALGSAGCVVEMALTTDRLPAAGDAELVVIDSYRHRADDASWAPGVRVVAIDDLERDLAVDVVVDPCPGATPPAHHRASRVLAGSAYVLIDPALAALALAPLRPAVHSVLVTTGGADQGGVGAALAAEVKRLVPDAGVRLVVGPWATVECPAGVELVTAKHGLTDELAAADIVLTAAGVTLLESLCLGRPTVAVVTAANQRRAADGVAAAGAAIVTSDADAATEVARLAKDGELRTTLGLAARRLVDGKGAERTARELLAHH